MADSIHSFFPNGGWDTHHHIYEPASFPYAADRHLTPPTASLQQYKNFKNRLGIRNSVLTHGLSYGDDCSSLKAFVPLLGLENTKAIGVIDPETITDDEMRTLHNAGVRGVRVNLYRTNAMENVELQKKALRDHATRIIKLSLPWSLTLTTTRPDFWTELAPFIESTIATEGIKVVSDHFCLLKGASMLPQEYQDNPASQPGFGAIMDAVRGGHLWVKLSAPYRASEMQPHYTDLKPLVRAFVDANKHRVLWGSDWPHTPRMRNRSREEALRESPFFEVDDEAWLRSLRSWLSYEEWNLLMVENPQRLFV